MSERSAYRFRHFGNRLVCIDQSVWQLLEALVLGYRRNGVRALGISVADSALALTMLVRHRVSRGARPPLEFPVFGHVAMKVHKGYKVFDLAQSTVTKLFSGDVTRAEAREQVDACRLASRVDAAPRFIAADPGGGWYREEYTPGTHGTDTGAASQGKFMDFYPDAEACLLDLIGVEAPLTVDLAAYIDELAEPLLPDAGNDSIWSKSVEHEVHGYQAHLKDWLLNNLARNELQLVLIHGDFSLVNAIISANGFRVIDWEGIRRGSLFGDCFNFVFAEKFYNRANGDVTSEISRVFEDFGKAVLDRYPQLEASTRIPLAFALRLYYLERLRVMLERDLSANLVSVIRKSIRMFREFDTAAALPAMGEK